MNYLIIGNGVAGTEAAMAIRKTDPDGDITIISKSKHFFYYRPRLIEYLAGEVTVDKFTLYKEDHYAKNRITCVLGTRIASIDAKKRAALDTEGRAYHFDRLLLATGAEPFVPPLEGADLDGVFTFRGITDADRIMEHCRGVDDIVILGGGLLGLETANAVSRFAKRVTVVEYFEWLLPRQLDRPGGETLRGMLEKRGMRFALGESVLSIRGSGSVESVLLKSGTEIPAGAVIISTGIKGRNELALSAGAEVKRGIVVDDYMATTVEGIYAAGDPVEHDGCLYGIWPAAREQGRIAGLNMAGAVTPYPKTLSSNVLKITGIDLYSAGEFNRDDAETYSCAADGTYIKFLQKGGPLGAVILGDPAAIRIARNVMERKGDPAELRDIIERASS